MVRIWPSNDVRVGDLCCHRLDHALQYIVAALPDEKGTVRLHTKGGDVTALPVMVLYPLKMMDHHHEVDWSRIEGADEMKARGDLRLHSDDWHAGYNKGFTAAEEMGLKRAKEEYERGVAEGGKMGQAESYAKGYERGQKRAQKEAYEHMLAWANRQVPR